jgi:cold-inducible RNA-binding protein
MSFKTTKEELQALLSEAGTIVDVHIPTDRESGRPRGFAFVRFSTDDEAAEAIRRFNGFDFGGRRLNVNEAEDRPRRTDGAPGPRPGGPPRDRVERDRPSGPGPSRAFAEAPPPPPDPAAVPQNDSEFRRRHTDDDDDSGGRSARGKGSRRGLRARKRSL